MVVVQQTSTMKLHAFSWNFNPKNLFQGLTKEILLVQTPVIEIICWSRYLVSVYYINTKRLSFGSFWRFVTLRPRNMYIYVFKHGLFCIFGHFLLALKFSSKHIFFFTNIEVIRVRYLASACTAAQQTSALKLRTYIWDFKPMSEFWGLIKVIFLAK